MNLSGLATSAIYLSAHKESLNIIPNYVQKKIRAVLDLGE